MYCRSLYSNSVKLSLTSAHRESGPESLRFDVSLQNKQRTLDPLLELIIELLLAMRLNNHLQFTHHIRGECGSCCRVRTVREVGVVAWRGAGERGRSGIGRKRRSRRGSPKFLGPGSRYDAGAVRRARIQGEGGGRLVQVALRIRHAGARRLEASELVHFPPFSLLMRGCRSA